FFQAEDGIRDFHVTGVQTCALPISINQVANTNWLGTGFAEITNLTPGGTAEINLTVQGTGGPFTLYVAFNDSGSNVLPISFPSEIGRASCRERVLMWVCAGCMTKQL